MDKHSIASLTPFNHVFGDSHVNLSEFLKKTQQDGTFLKEIEENRQDFVKFLEKIRVAPLNDAVTPPISPKDQLPLTFREIVNMTIERLVKQDKGSKNVLTLGYRSVRDHLVGGIPGTVSLEQVFPNSIVSHVCNSDDWETLLSFVGVKWFNWLFMNCMLFEQLNGGSWLQLAGPLYTEFVYSRPFHDKKDEKKRKRGDSENQAIKKRKMEIPKDLPPLARATSPESEPKEESKEESKPKGKLRTPSQIIIARSKMYYARALRGKTGRVLVGLPKYHSLNTHKTNQKSLKKALVDMFPRQFNLESVFNVSTQPNWKDRGMQVQKKSVKLPQTIPKRLKKISTLIEKIWKNNHNLNYRGLLDHHCPPTKREVLGWDPKVSGNRPMTQAVPRAWDADRSRVEMDLSDDEDFAPEFMDLLDELDRDEDEVMDIRKINFAENRTPYHKVYNWVHAVVKRLFPLEFFGSQHNFNHMLNFVKKIISMRRGESLCLHETMQGLKVNEFGWCQGGKTGTVPLHERNIREKLVQDWVVWFFEGFLIPLLRTTFYITETSSERNKIHYFRQDVWQALSEPAFKWFRSQMFEDMTHVETARALQNRPLAYSYVRILPKEFGARPISNLKRKFTAKEVASGIKDRHQKDSEANNIAKAIDTLPSNSINNLLQPVFQVLTREKTRFPELLGSTVLNIPDIYCRLKPFKQRIMDQDGNLPPLYFAKVDVKGAFDSVRQEKLVEIVEKLIQEDEYCLYKYSVAFPTAGRLRTTFVKKASEEMPDFVNVAQDLSKTIHNAVFVDHVVYNFEDRKELLHLLKLHLEENIVNMNSQFCKQVVGIPQGSVLSTLLVSFFYGDMERNKLKFVQEDPNGVLLRYVDDFLYVSTDKQRVIDFVTEMYGGHPEYGCFVNKPKTLVNFDLHVYGQRVKTLEEERCDEPHHLNDFAWCGLFINTKTLNVTGDYTRLQKVCLRDGLNVENHSHPGKRLRESINNFIRPRCHALYVDMDYNGRPTMLKNIYQNFLHCAIKTHLFAKDLQKKDGHYLMECIEEALKFTHVHVKSRLRHENAVKLKAKNDLTLLEVEYLGLSAFKWVMRRHHTLYPVVLQEIDTRLNHRKFKFVTPSLKMIVREEENVDFGKIKF